MSLTRASGRKTATVVTVEAVTAAATSRTPALMASSFVFAEPQVPLDVLDHDDRVVDHAADRDRQRAEGEHVERVAGRAACR